MTEMVPRMHAEVKGTSTLVEDRDVNEDRSEGKRKILIEAIATTGQNILSQSFHVQFGNYIEGEMDKIRSK